MHIPQHDEDVPGPGSFLRWEKSNRSPSEDGKHGLGKKGYHQQAPCDDRNHERLIRHHDKCRGGILRLFGPMTFPLRLKKGGTADDFQYLQYLYPSTLEGNAATNSSTKREYELMRLIAPESPRDPKAFFDPRKNNRGRHQGRMVMFRPLKSVFNHYRQPKLPRCKGGW